MAAILEDDNFRCIFLNESVRIPVRISLNLVPKSPIDNKPAIAWTNADPVHWRIYAALGGGGGGGS